MQGFTLLGREETEADQWNSKYISFPDHQNFSQSELSNMVYNRLKTAPPFSIMKLPDRHLVLPCIVIKHPMIITGTPGTIVEIVNGNVICDFR